MWSSDKPCAIISEREGLQNRGCCCVFWICEELDYLFILVTWCIWISDPRGACEGVCVDTGGAALAPRITESDAISDEFFGMIDWLELGIFQISAVPASSAFELSSAVRELAIFDFLVLK